MEHRDSTGGGGLLRGGDTQWMTAGGGLVHSEMPTAAMLRDGGLMHGVQLWVNLPRADKLTPPRYQDLTGDKLTLVRSADGRALVRLIAGELGGHTGPGQHAHADRVRARDDRRRRSVLGRVARRVQRARLRVARHACVVGGDARPVGAHQLAVLGREGETLVVEADEPADVLLLGGRPLREPVAWYGPFVMNTKQEIIDAVDDYEAGRLGTISPRGT